MVIGFSLSCFNIAILVISAIHNQGWRWAVVLGIVIFVSILYFSIIILSTQKLFGENGGWWLSWVGWEANLITLDEKREKAVRKTDDYHDMNERTRVREDGTTVIVEHKVGRFVERFPRLVRYCVDKVAPSV